MCLRIDEPSTEKAKQTLWTRATFYKVLMISFADSKPALIAPFREKIYKAGYNKSDRITLRINRNERTSGLIGKGIHVYRTRNRAGMSSAMGHFSIIVPVLCYKKDLVAYGKGSEAVFMKVFLSKKNLETATKDY